MVRPLRIEYAGAVYHLTSRGNERKAIFLDDEDRQLFLETLGTCVSRYRWLCYAYSLMGNHYHLVIETPEANLSLGMRHLNGLYTQWFNRKHERCGHLFQGRFHSVVIQKDTHLLAVCRYVDLNAVRAGLVGHPDAWPWCSFRALAEKAPAPGFLSPAGPHGMLAGSSFGAGESYRAFVLDGLKATDLWDGLKAGTLLGSEPFVMDLLPLTRGRERVPEFPKEQRFASRPDLDALLAGCVADRRLRNRRIREAVLEHGYSQRQVADHLGLHFSSVSRLMREIRPDA